MESNNQSFNQTLNGIDSEKVPLFASYLTLVIGLVSAVIVITPSLMVINVIQQTRELHTKYFFLVAHLLGNDIAATTFRFLRQCFIIILYLLGLNPDSTTIIMKWLMIPVTFLPHIMAIVLPITLVIERMIAIVFPFRHRSIMTTKRVARMLAIMWGSSAILIIIIVAVVPIEIVWPLALVVWHARIFPFMIVVRLLSSVSIIVPNVVLQYKITLSNRKAEENKRLGNEEEVKKFKRLHRELRSQAKATITLFLVGGIDVLANILLPIFYGIFFAIAGPASIYAFRFLTYPLEVGVSLSHPLLYGLYMKKIRRRLPNWCTAVCNCHRQWIVHRHNRVGVLRQQQRAAVVTSTTV